VEGFKGHSFCCSDLPERHGGEGRVPDTANRRGPAAAGSCFGHFQALGSGGITRKGGGGSHAVPARVLGSDGDLYVTANGRFVTGGGGATDPRCKARMSMIP
jgi:hypothetical protein